MPEGLFNSDEFKIHELAVEEINPERLTFNAIEEYGPSDWEKARQEISDSLSANLEGYLTLYLEDAAPLAVMFPEQKPILYPLLTGQELREQLHDYSEEEWKESALQFLDLYTLLDPKTVRAQLERDEKGFEDLEVILLDICAAENWLGFADSAVTTALLYPERFHIKYYDQQFGKILDKLLAEVKKAISSAKAADIPLYHNVARLAAFTRVLYSLDQSELPITQEEYRVMIEDLRRKKAETSSYVHQLGMSLQLLFAGSVAITENGIVYTQASNKPVADQIPPLPETRSF
jgi:hypothetical protein